MVIAAILSEFVANIVLGDPMAVGILAIYPFLALIIYFSFRDSLRGGFVAVTTTIAYYFYIIVTRNFTGERLVNALEATFTLFLIYCVLAWIIGWLKQEIDTLIQQETKARLEAQEGELRLQTILQQLPIGVLLVQANTYEVDGNAQLEKILGKKLDSHLALDYPEPIHSHTAKRPLKTHQWPLMRALLKGETVVGEELELPRADQKKIFLKVNTAPIRNTEQVIVAAVSTLQDITAEKLLELQKDDFVNMASHELKTPLTSLGLYLESLQRRLEVSPDTRAQQIVQRMQTQTQRLQTLVSDLLDVSRLQTGKLTLNKERFSMHDLIVETIEMLPDKDQQRITFEPRKNNQNAARSSAIDSASTRFSRT